MNLSHLLFAAACVSNRIIVSLLNSSSRSISLYSVNCVAGYVFGTPRNFSFSAALLFPVRTILVLAAVRSFFSQLLSISNSDELVFVPRGFLLLAMHYQNLFVLIKLAS